MISRRGELAEAEERCAERAVAEDARGVILFLFGELEQLDRDIARRVQLIARVV